MDSHVNNKIIEHWGKNSLNNFIYHSLKRPALKSEMHEFWFVEGNYYNKEEYCLFLNKNLYFKSKGKVNPNPPTVIYFNGTKEWWSINWKKGIDRHLNKFDGPAVVYSNGDCEYWIDGKRHRIGGPAVLIGNKQYWFIYGDFVKCIV